MILTTQIISMGMSLLPKHIAKRQTKLTKTESMNWHGMVRSESGGQDLDRRRTDRQCGSPRVPTDVGAAVTVDTEVRVIQFSRDLRRR